jgi:biotin synthase
MKTLSTKAILALLKTTDTLLLNQLFNNADNVRKKYVGDAVHLRGLLEISNHCSRSCHYCGLRKQNTKLNRYRMLNAEILECAKLALKLGYGTVVLQAGEDLDLSPQEITTTIETLKQTTNLAITLSLGERNVDELYDWKRAGADRYLLRFETSDSDLYQKIHPAKNSNKISSPNDRIDLLKAMQQMGYEIGSGIMIGIPGQTYQSLAQDLLLCQKLDLDMVGVGPYITNPDTPLGQTNITETLDQVPNTELMTYKVMALTRLLCNDANIPSATALASLNKTSGRELGLQRGANVVMPNVTPPQYRVHYLIYPGKACINETAKQCQHCMQKRIASIGRFIGQGQGNRVKK